LRTALPCTQSTKCALLLVMIASSGVFNRMLSTPTLLHYDFGAW